MNVESRLRKLEMHYRAALSGAVVAKAQYLAQLENRAATPSTVIHLQRRWKELEARRRDIAARMERLEGLERMAMH